MVKNTNEKPQTFDNFKAHVRNWDINECIILEMFEDQNDSKMNQQEKNFQKMLVNNMESVFKIFFRGMQTIRVQSDAVDDESIMTKSVKNSFNLTQLAQNKVVATRIRADTGVKQYHAG